MSSFGNMPSVNRFILGASIASSFTLYGNTFTQCFMGVPALLVDFPAPISPAHHDRARLLGRQWPTLWQVGNWYFRPISMLGALGYLYTAYVAYNSPQSLRDVVRGSRESVTYAVAGLCHAATVLHSAVNMQPLNAKIQALAWESNNTDANREDKTEEMAVEDEVVHVALAEQYALAWIQGNFVRMATSWTAGSLALWQILRTPGFVQSD